MTSFYQMYQNLMGWAGQWRPGTKAKWVSEFGSENGPSKGKREGRCHFLLVQTFLRKWLLAVEMGCWNDNRNYIL